VAVDWPSIRREGSTGRLTVLPPDAMTIRAFLGLGVQVGNKFPGTAIEQAARLTHEMFLDESRYRHPDAAMQPWHALDADLRESNLSQVAYLVEILDSCGFSVQAFHDVPRDPRFTGAEIKRMGEMEHGRWNVERLFSGWKYSPLRDSNRRLSPYLLPWAKLERAVQKYDLRDVQHWPSILAEVGYEIRRRKGSTRRIPAR